MIKSENLKKSIIQESREIYLNVSEIRRILFGYLEELEKKHIEKKLISNYNLIYRDSDFKRAKTVQSILEKMPVTRARFCDYKRELLSTSRFWVPI